VTVASPLDLLRDHVGHLGVWTEQPGRIGWRCRSTSCPGYNRVVDLSSVFGLRPSSARPTSTSTSRPAPRDPSKAEECPAHPGEFRHNCRSCAADAKAAGPDAPKVAAVQPGTPGWERDDWQAVKADMAARRVAARERERAEEAARRRTAGPGHGDLGAGRADSGSGP
jgi:hypothetical protein